MGNAKIDVFTKYGVSDEIKKSLQALIVKDDVKVEHLIRQLTVPHPHNQNLVRALREGDLKKCVVILTALGFGDYLKVQKPKKEPKPPKEPKSPVK